jgi:hypothetical protein
MQWRHVHCKEMDCVIRRETFTVQTSVSATMAEDEVEAYVQTLTKLCPEAAADAPDEIRYIASMLADKVRVQSARELQCKCAVSDACST